MKDDNYNSTATGQANRGIVIYLPGWLAIALSASAVLMFGLVAFVWFKPPNAAGAPEATPFTSRASVGTAPSSLDQSKRGNPGPWGELEYVAITLERPDEFVYTHSQADYWERPTRWFFEGVTQDELKEIFRSTPGLVAKHQTILLDSSQWESSTNGIIVTPPRSLVLELARPAREKLYPILANSEANPFHFSPFSFHVADANEWFANSELSASTLELLQRLVYRRGETLCFSDLPEVQATLSSKQERRRLLKTLSRQRSILMKLRVQPGTNVDALVDYWGKGGRAKDIRPLIESLTRVRGGTSIDIAHLLPPFARMHLYSFPYPSTDPIISRRNCFWTALNFFNEQPDDRFCDVDFTQQAIQEHYYPIQDEPTYGDVVFLLDHRESVVHAAVYLADDMVFTKNGRNFTEPWRIMSVAEMIAEYPSNTPMRPVVFRRKML